MTDKLLCPYCKKPLHCGAQLDSDGYIIELYQCANPECESTEFLVGCREFWDILGQHIDTKKKLDIAIWGLEWIFGYENVPKYVLQHIRKVLDAIKDKERQ